MTQAARRLAIAVLAVSALAGGLAPRALRAASDTLPAALSDQEFWSLSGQLSEPNGFFRSDNLVSNEIWFQRVIPLLVNRTERGGVYMGVGPEQNFTYIAAVHPRMVFFPDIRRGNLHLQLMYKALFELSMDRADFVSRLFNRKRPDGLTPQSSVREIFDAFAHVPMGDTDLYAANLRAIDDHLTKKHHLPLDADDLAGIDAVYRSFRTYGPDINYNSSQANARSSFVSYRGLMLETDEGRASRSYLANEDNFTFVRELEANNLMVPVVGDLSGPKAVRAIGQYVRDHQATISVFYLSNVEQYLTGDGVYSSFCANVASLPLTPKSTFIRTTRTGYVSGRPGMMSMLGSMKAEVESCDAAR